VVHAEAPSSLLYNFDGYLDHDGSKHALTASQLLLRGAVLKNTAEVIGASGAAPAQAAQPRLRALTNRASGCSVRASTQAWCCLQARRPRCG